MDPTKRIWLTQGDSSDLSLPVPCQATFSSQWNTEVEQARTDTKVLNLLYDAKGMMNHYFSSFMALCKDPCEPQHILPELMFPASVRIDVPSLCSSSSWCVWSHNSIAPLGLQAVIIHSCKQKSNEIIVGSPFQSLFNTCWKCVGFCCVMHAEGSQTRSQ